ncbi:MAG: 30S ribosomal protein S9 [Limnochordales bacterium]|nr:30S ribosomal protein S9 [Limnochordales bacterium]
MAATIPMATGRRKTAVARVRLMPGSGRIVVNGKEAKEYFGRDLLVQAIEEVFRVAGVEVRWDVVANVRGGGIVAQAYAVRHGLARALQMEVPELRAPLKKAGFLTRDPRMKERRKYGLKKARKAPQYSKR